MENENKKAFETIGQQMDFLANAIKKNKDIELLNDEVGEQISNCCSALMSMGTCLDCKEPAQPVEENDDDYQEMVAEEEKRNQEKLKY